MQIIENKALLLKLRDPGRVTTVIPKSKVLDSGEVVVKWGLEEAQVLKNLRIKDVPSPILGNYNWPGYYRPFAHQKQTAAFLTLHKRAFCFNEQGTGKTGSVIWAADYLLSIGAIKRVLVVCPLSIMQSAWQNDLFRFAMHRTVAIAHSYSREKRIQAVNSDAEFVIVNFDGLNIIQDAVKNGGFDLVVIDEANAYKTVSTTRWKTLNAIIKPDTWLWMLTGTPASQSPTDAYGLAKLVAPSRVPKFFGAYRDMVMQKVTMFKWMPKPRAEDIVYDVLQPAIRFTKEECLDLPDMTYTTRDVPLTTQQFKYYEIIRKNMLATAAGEEITTVNAAANLNKLLQLSCLSATTKVLTNSGWKYILEVTTRDKLWDGEDWVSHNGVTFMGVKPTVSLDGVSMTADHRVLTISGWHTCEDIINGKQSDRFDRAAVRAPDGFRAEWHDRTQLCDLGVPVRLWEQNSTEESKSAIQDETFRESLWVSGIQNKPNPRHGILPPFPHMEQHEKKVLRQTRQRLQKLRSTWHNSMRTMGTFISEFLGGHAAGVHRPTDTGQNRQQRPVLFGELSLGYSTGTIQQHEGKQNYNDTKRGYDNNTSCENIWSKKSNTTCTNNTVQLACGKSTNPPDQEAVYDIVNAGPRNRFTVLGTSGPFIVHNCGAVYADSGEVVAFDSSNRIEALKEVIEEASHKVLVFVPYRHAIELVTEALRKEGINTEIINGAVPVRKRTEIFESFQTTPDPKVLVIQPQAAAHGVTLTAANVVVWFSPITSVETYLQANARVHRAGQHNPCTVVHLQGSPVEKKMYKMLQSKVDIHVKMIDLYKNIIEDEET